MWTYNRTYSPLTDNWGVYTLWIFLFPSLYSPGWPRAHYMDQTGLVLPKGLGYRCEPPHLASFWVLFWWWWSLSPRTIACWLKALPWSYPSFSLFICLRCLAINPGLVPARQVLYCWKMSSFYLSVCLFVFVCWAPPTSGPCAWEAGPLLLSYRSQFLWGIVNNTATNIHVYLLRHLLSVLSSICPGAALLDHTVILYSVFLKNYQALFHSGWAQIPLLLPHSISASCHSCVFFFLSPGPPAELPSQIWNFPRLVPTMVQWLMPATS